MSPDRKALLRDIAITAIEGGVGYWADIVRYRWSTGEEPLTEHMLEFPEIVLQPLEEDDELTVTQRTIQHGLALILEGKVWLRPDLYSAIVKGSAENDASYIDAEGADCIVQLGLFDALVYG